MTTENNRVREHNGQAALLRALPWIIGGLCAVILWELGWRNVLLNPDDLRFGSDFGKHELGQSSLAEVFHGAFYDYFTRSGRTGDVVSRLIFLTYPFWDVTLAVISALETLSLAWIVKSVLTLAPGQQKALTFLKNLSFDSGLILLAFAGLFLLTARNQDQIGTFVFWPSANATYLWELVLVAPAIAALAWALKGKKMPRGGLFFSVIFIVLAALHLELFGVVFLGFSLGYFALRKWLTFPEGADSGGVNILVGAALVGGLLSLAGPGHYVRLHSMNNVDEPKLRRLFGQGANALVNYHNSLPAFTLISLVLLFILGLTLLATGNRTLSGPQLRNVMLSSGGGIMLWVGAKRMVVARQQSIMAYQSEHPGVAAMLTSKVAPMVPTLAVIFLTLSMIVGLLASLWFARQIIGLAPAVLGVVGTMGLALPVLSSQHVPRTYSVYTLSVIVINLVILATFLGFSFSSQKLRRSLLAGLLPLTWIVGGGFAYANCIVILHEHFERWAPTMEAVARKDKVIEYPPGTPDAMGYWNPFVDHGDLLVKPAYGLDKDTILIPMETYQSETR